MKHKLIAVFTAFVMLGKTPSACTLEQLNERMPHFMRHNMFAHQSFKQLLDDAVALRLDCANRYSDKTDYSLTLESYIPLAQCETAFNDMMDNSLENSKKLENLAMFCYTFLNSNIFKNGVDTYAQWMIQSLSFYQNLSLPTLDFKKLLTLSKSDLFDQFHVPKKSIFPTDLTDQERIELEGLYKKYFLKDLNKNVWDDFTNQPRGVTNEKRSEELVVSMTSYPERMLTTWLAIESILRQEDMPDRVVLNLFEGEFPDKKLPWTMEQQMKRGLEINWSPINRKVFLKVIPTVQKYPHACVVAVDDDTIYPPKRLKTMIEDHQKFPNCVISPYVRILPIVDGFIPPVRYWKTENAEEKKDPSFNLIPSGLWGTLYPPHAFSSFFDKPQMYEDLCPTEDDFWWYVCAISNNTKVYKPASFDGFEPISRAQESSKTLNATNIKDQCAQQDLYFQKLFNAGLLSNTGAKKIAPNAWQFLKDVNQKTPPSLSLSTKNAHAMIHLPISFDEGFFFMTDNGLMMRGNTFSFHVCTSKFKENTIHIKLAYLFAITQDQPFIRYSIVRVHDGKTITNNMITQSKSEIDIVDQCDQDIVEYRMITDAKPQDWMLDKHFFVSGLLCDVLLSATIE